MQHFLMALVGLSIIGVMQLKASPQETLLRINSGIIFHFKSIGHQQNSFWSHSFILEYFNFTKLQMTFDIPDCANSSNLFCLEVRRTMQLFRIQRKSTIQRIAKLQRLIQDVLPQPGSRAKKGLFDLGGAILSNVFGLATERQMKDVTAHLDMVQKGQVVNANQIVKVEGELSSLINLTDSRFKGTFEAIEMNHQDNENLKLSLESLIKQEYQLANYARQAHILIRSLAIYMDTVIALEEQTLNLLRGVNTLIKGYIGPELIPVESLQKVLHMVTRVLRRKNTGFTLLYDKPSMYYQAKDLVAYTQTRQGILINLKIPLVSTLTQFHLYSVQSIDMPTNNTSANTTKIVDIEPYFAITMDQEYHASIDIETYRTCSGEHVMFCTAGIPMRPRSYQTCLSALYFDIPDLVLKLCKFTYKTNHVLDSIIQVNDDHVLISSSNANWQINCPGERLKHKYPTNYGLLQVPCGCSIEARDFYLPARISNCQSKTKNLTVFHALNIPVLKALQSTSKLLSKLSLSEVYSQPQKVILPELPITNTNWSDVLEMELSAGLDFKKLAAKANSQRELYAKKTDFLWSTVQSMQTESTWSIINSVAIGLSFIINIWLICKMRGVAAMLAALPRVNALGQPMIQVSNSTDVFHFDYEKIEQVLDEEQSIRQILEFFIITAVAYIVLRYLLLDIWRLIGRRIFHWACVFQLVSGHFAELLLELRSGDDSLALTLGKIPCHNWANAREFLHQTNIKIKQHFQMGVIEITYPSEIRFQKYLLAKLYVPVIYRSNVKRIFKNPEPEFSLYLVHGTDCVQIVTPMPDNQAETNNHIV